MRTPRLPSLLPTVLAAILCPLVLPIAGATPSALSASDSHSPPIPPTPVPPITLAKPQLLIIAHADLATAWQPLADWKTAQGIPTVIHNLDDIVAAHPAEDVQASIRLAVRDHVDRFGTRWVLLGGDSTGPSAVPDRDSTHPEYGYSDIPTDVYYTATTTWDADGDGVYGEFADDQSAISYGDGTTAVGRVPVRSADQIAAYTDKVITYESAYPSNGFATSMLQTGAVDSAFAKLGTSRDRITNAWHGGEIRALFHTNGDWNADASDHRLYPSTIVNDLNQGRHGKIHFHGHGMPRFWVLEHDLLFDVNRVSVLENREALPVVTTVSCFTGQFDSPTDPSITEAMLRHANGGAIALIAPAREGVPVFADRSDYQRMLRDGLMDGTTQLLTNFWSIGLGQNLSLGEALAQAKAQLFGELPAFPGRHWVLSELNLLGDPSLPIHARAPITPELALPTSLKPGAQSLRFQIPIAGLRVCAWQPDGVYAVTHTDADGHVVLSLAPEAGTSVRITVAGAGVNVTSVELPVRAE